jgi:hypothetical protein
MPLFTFHKFHSQYFWRAAAAALWVYVFIRAKNLSFTHDECLSYTIVLGDTGRALTPNHHYLNTWLMQWSAAMFGPSELSLRAGSLLAFVLYLWGGLQLISTAKRMWIQAAGFALLFLNPFLLDFFGLARGYSWALTGVIGMLLALQRLATRETPESGRGSRVFWMQFGLTASVVALLGNLALFNVVAPYCGLLILLQLLHKGVWRPSWRGWLFALFFGGALVFTLSEAFRLKKRGEFYFGGQNGFVSDTVASLADCSLYLQDYGKNVPAGLTNLSAGLMLLLVAGAAVGWFRQKRAPLFFTLSAAFFGLTAACVLAQRLLLKTPLPTDRMATYFLLLFGVTIFAALKEGSESIHNVLRTGAIVISTIILTVLGFHFGQSANLSHCFMWHYDRNTRTAIEKIAEERDKYQAGKTVKLAAHALFEPACNYYRLLKGCDWLETIPKEGVKDKAAEYYYTLWDDFGTIPNNQGMWQTVSFESTRSTVWRRQ